MINQGDYFKFEDSYIVYECFQVNKLTGTSVNIRNLKGDYCGCINRSATVKILTKKEVIELCTRKYQPTIIPHTATTLNRLPEKFNQ